MSATASLPTPRVDVIPERWALIDQIRLSPGTHNRPSGNDLPTGMCVMEFDSWLTGGWGDRPECVSPVLWPVFQRLNDRLQDEPRQALLLYGIRALGTAGDGLDEQRRAVAWAAVPDMLVPWLRLAGLDEEADAVLTAGDVAALRTACRAAYDAARTARLAARARLHKRVEKGMRKELEKRLAAEAAEAALAAGSSHWTIRTRVYDAVRAYFREHPPVLPAEVTELAGAQQGAALELLARLIDPTQDGAS